MTFDEFKTWFATLDSTLAGAPPELAQWWELKARLDAVEAPSAPAAPPSDPLTAPQADRPFGDRGVETEDTPPPLAPVATRLSDLHVEDMPPSEFTVFEEAVQLLKKPRRRA